LSELAQHLANEKHLVPPPGAPDAPTWLPHYLGAASADDACSLGADFFRQKLEAGDCTVLLDGMDEAPDRVVRERISRLIQNAARTYGGCRFVATSRLATNVGEAVLPGFAQANISPLSDEMVVKFLTEWCAALCGEGTDAAREHLAELLEAVRARPEIHRMARNPVMLTALAVVHWNERRLPEQRAELYNSIITWLARSREQRQGRADENPRQDPVAPSWLQLADQGAHADEQQPDAADANRQGDHRQQHLGEQLIARAVPQVGRARRVAQRLVDRGQEVGPTLRIEQDEQAPDAHAEADQPGDRQDEARQTGRLDSSCGHPPSSPE